MVINCTGGKCVGVSQYAHSTCRNMHPLRVKKALGCERKLTGQIRKFQWSKLKSEPLGESWVWFLGGRLNPRGSALQIEKLPRVRSQQTQIVTIAISVGKIIAMASGHKSNLFMIIFLD